MKYHAHAIAMQRNRGAPGTRQAAGRSCVGLFSCAIASPAGCAAGSATTHPYWSATMSSLTVVMRLSSGKVRSRRSASHAMIGTSSGKNGEVEYALIFRRDARLIIPCYPFIKVAMEGTVPRTEQGVVDAVSEWLDRNGFTEVDPIPAGARGYDITALHLGTRERWIIEAKGGAHNGTDTSNAAWMRTGAALLMAAGWRFQENIPGDRFAIALPKSRWFDIHIDRIHGALRHLGISVF
jgi:hypothetical protein